MRHINQVRFVRHGLRRIGVKRRRTLLAHVEPTWGHLRPTEIAPPMSCSGELLLIAKRQMPMLLRTRWFRRSRGGRASMPAASYDGGRSDDLCCGEGTVPTNLRSALFLTDSKKLGQSPAVLKNSNEIISKTPSPRPSPDGEGFVRVPETTSSHLRCLP
jgi:hypothetical protein